MPRRSPVRALARAVLLLVPFLAPAAHAQGYPPYPGYGAPYPYAPAPVVPQVAPAPCIGFGAFPLSINLGSGLQVGDGETVRCALGKVMTAVNALSAIATAPPTGAPLASPTFTGVVTMPTLALTSNIAAVQPAAASVAQKLPGTFLFAANNNNSVVGSVLHNRPPGTLSFDTALTGYGQLAATSSGNNVFGLFGRADLLAPAGTVTNEVNSFNYGGQDAPTAYPWSRAIGTTQALPVALTVAAGGTNKSAAGIEIAQEGEKPSYFQYGIVMRPEVNSLWNIWLDANANSSALNGIYSATKGQGVNLVLQTTTASTPKQPVMSVRNYGYGEVAAITVDGTGFFDSLNLKQHTPASSSAACTVGDLTMDPTYVYVCIQPNRWRRVLLNDW